jgi:hypothetical protein
VVDGKGSSRDSYDRLLGVRDSTEVEWKQECIYCKSKKLVIHPLGVAYQPHTVDNYDDLPEEVRKYYAYLPNVYEATMQCLMEIEPKVLVECMDCGQCISGLHNEKPEAFADRSVKVKPNRSKVKKYLQQLYGCGEELKFLKKVK